MSKSGGGGGTQKTTSEPWKEVQPYLKEAYGRAENLYTSGEGPEYYPGQTYVPTDPLRQEAWGMAEDYARNQLPTDIEGVRGAYGSLMGALDVNNNPYLAKAVQGAINPMIDSFREELLPSLRQGEILAGQFGGSEGEEAAGLAAGKLTRNIGDISSQMYSDAYQQGLDTVMKSMMFAPQIMSLSQLPAQQLEQIGIAKEGEAGKALTDSMNRWNYEQQLPYSMLSDYMNILNGSSAWGTQTGRSSQQPYTDPISGILGLVSMGSYLFSDVRVKQNIKRVGTTDGGLPVYTYQYKWGGPMQMGVMAQEVEQVNPDAVVEVNGIKMVDYSKVQ